MTIILTLLRKLFGSFPSMEFVSTDSLMLARALALASTIGALLAGLVLVRRFTRQADKNRNAWAEIGICAIVAMLYALVWVVVLSIIPHLLIDAGSLPTWIIAMSASAALVPVLLMWAFRFAVDFEPRRYRPWYFPATRHEPEQAWDPKKSVNVNLHFSKAVNEGPATTVNVKLPQDGALGELAYLFIRDYNENRYPEAPIGDLQQPDGRLGWIFRKPRYLFPKQRKWAWKQEILDPALTIAENKIGRDHDVFFDRVVQDKAGA